MHLGRAGKGWGGGCAQAFPERWCCVRVGGALLFGVWVSRVVFGCWGGGLWLVWCGVVLMLWLCGVLAGGVGSLRAFGWGDVRGLVCSSW